MQDHISLQGVLSSLRLSLLFIAELATGIMLLPGNVKCLLQGSGAIMP